MNTQRESLIHLSKVVVGVVVGGWGCQPIKAVRSRVYPRGHLPTIKCTAVTLA